MVATEGRSRRRAPLWVGLFGRCGIQNLSLQIIAGCKDGEEEALAIAEGNWISRLGTLDSQGGLNSKDERRKI